MSENMKIGSNGEEVARGYRKHDWYDSKTGNPKYGIQVKMVGWQVRYLHCHEGGKPCIYDTEEERDAKLKELRKGLRKAKSND